MEQVYHLASQAASTGIPVEGVDKDEIHMVLQQCPLTQTSGKKNIQACFFLNHCFLLAKYKLGTLNNLVYLCIVFAFLVEIPEFLAHSWLPKLILL
jgi:hypothetical protein